MAGRLTDALLRVRDKNVLRLDVAVDDLERVQVSQTRRDLLQCPLRVERDRDVAELVWPLNDVCERRRAELESDVEEVGVGFLVVVPDDVWMVVGFLEDRYLARC